VAPRAQRYEVLGDVPAPRALRFVVVDVALPPAPTAAKLAAVTPCGVYDPLINGSMRLLFHVELFDRSIITRAREVSTGSGRKSTSTTSIP
jgi:hypothetical protein